MVTHPELARENIRRVTASARRAAPACMALWSREWCRRGGVLLLRPFVLIVRFAVGHFSGGNGDEWGNLQRTPYELAEAIIDSGGRGGARA